jgi:hypothetical protein
MSQPAELPPWLLADLGPTMVLATVLTGSGRGATELVAESLARDRSWTDVQDGYDLRPRLRVAVVRSFLASPLGRSRPPGSATGLDALPGVVRAGVVLRDAEHLTVGEIATILDRPAKRVVADLGRLPDDYRAELAHLTRLAPSVGQLPDRFTTASRSVRRGRRRRTVLIGLAAALTAVAVAVPTVVLPRLPVDVREPGTWRYSHDVRLAPGWLLVLRSIQSDSETTVIRVPQPRADPAECTVTVRVRGAQADRSGDSKPISVRSRPGELLTGPGSAVKVNWQYAPGAWASAECGSPAGDDAGLALELAASVRFGDSRQLLPFLLSPLPEGYRVDTVGEVFQPMWGSDRGWGPTVLLEPPVDSYRPAVMVGPDLTGSGDSSASTIVRCLAADGTVCVSTFGTDDQVPANQAMLRWVLGQTVDGVQLAADPADRSTWFDAIDLPTG